MSDVPCNGCTLCCQSGAVILMPGEEGYETEQFADGVKMLAHKPDGSCVYLTESGCGIYERRPSVCRLYDCRKMFMEFTKAKRQSYIDAGLCSEEEFEKGKSLQYTLTHEERQECRRKRDKV